jgi:6-phosphofructokinase 1
MSAPDAPSAADAADAAGTPSPSDVAIETLGPARRASPVAGHLGAAAVHYVGDTDRVLVDDSLSALRAAGGMPDALPSFELAGPRDRIFFDPRTLSCGIVTCGGLAPGLNNVIRGIVLELWNGYGVRRITGFRHGYEGLVPRHGHAPMALDPDSVAHVHHEGGTVLGTSRGSQDPVEIVDHLEANGIGALFVIGGDGSLAGALRIAGEVRRRGARIAVVGVPKTIDNDIGFIDRSFGYLSAYSAAVDAIRGARVEAMAAREGIGLVKLMGRHSGFLACQAALASTEVDLVLIPEVPLRMAGEGGVLACVDRVLARKGHAVIVVAEGSGQDLIDAPPPGADPLDRSGNLRLRDVGPFLRDALVEHRRARGGEANVKYIDPSYIIRSVAACPSDSVYCWDMARHAVHAAMSGHTAMLIGRWHGRFVHVPIALAIRRRRHVDPDGDLWMSVIESTGQPRRFG